MKVLHIGSDSIHVSSYITALQEEGVKQFLVSENRCDFAHVIEEVNVSFRKMTPGFILRNRKVLKQFIQSVNPDVIHVHQVNRLGFFTTIIARRMRIPVVTTAWGSDVLLMPQQNKVYRYLVKKILLNSEVVTGDSQEMIAAMEAIVPDKRKYVKLQYGITPVEEQEKQQVIFSNRVLWPLYRIDKIVDYFAEFNDSNPGWELHIAGTGPEEQQLREQVAKLGLQDSVRFLGYLQTADNRQAYASASIFVSIPESDGTSVSLLEAMSAGCIPVVSDLVVSREWITDGENGIIVKNGVNPFEEALRLDRQKVAGLNKAIIDKEATRAISLAAFKGFYNKLIHEK